MLFIMDCSLVGGLYILVSLLGGLLGFGFSAHMSLELVLPYSVYGDDMFYVCITAHAVSMVFFFLSTLATGFSNFLVPGMLGCDDFFFPSLNSFSLWLIVLSLVFLVLSLLFGSGVNTGWTAYPPLSGSNFSCSYSVEFFVMAVHLFSVSTVLSSVNLICTVFFFKPVDMEWLNVSVYIWSLLVTAVLNMLSLPYFTSAVTMLFLDSNFSSVFFDPVFGGDPLLFQSLFWFWGHPEVYMLIMPVFGLVSLVISEVVGVETLFGNSCMVVSLMSVSILGFMVWGHHMVTVGWNLDLSTFFMAATVVISLPTGLKIFNWVCSVYFCAEEESLQDISLYFMLAFMVVFIFGGVTGVMLSNSSLDVLFHDSYFVVGHFHYILSLAAVLGYFSFLSFLWSSLTGGLTLDFWLGMGSLLTFFTSSNVVFFPFHILGLMGLPSSVSCYPDFYYCWFYISSCGFAVVMLSMVFLVVLLLFSVGGGYLRPAMEEGLLYLWGSISCDMASWVLSVVLVSLGFGGILETLETLYAVWDLSQFLLNCYSLLNYIWGSFKCIWTSLLVVWFEFGAPKPSFGSWSDFGGHSLNMAGFSGWSPAGSKYDLVGLSTSSFCFDGSLYHCGVLGKTSVLALDLDQLRDWELSSLMFQSCIKSFNSYSSGTEDMYWDDWEYIGPFMFGDMKWGECPMVYSGPLGGAGVYESSYTFVKQFVLYSGLVTPTSSSSELWDLGLLLPYIVLDGPHANCMHLVNYVPAYGSSDSDLTKATLSPSVASYCSMKMCVDSGYSPSVFTPNSYYDMVEEDLSGMHWCQDLQVLG